MTRRLVLTAPATWRTFFMGSLASVAFPVSALLTAPILARGLGPHGRGELAALLTPLAIAEAISALGVPLAAAYFVRSGFSLGSVRKAGLAIVTVSGLLTTLVLLIAAPHLFEDYPGLVPVFRWLALGTAVNVYIELYRGIRSGQEAYGPVNANYWLSAAGRLVGVVALALADALTPTRVAVLSIGIGLVSGLTMCRTPRRRVREQGPAIEVLRVLRFSMSTWAGVVSASIGSRLDQFLLIGLAAPASLGVYAVAVTAAQVPMAVFPAFQRLFLNRATVSPTTAILRQAGQLSSSFALLMVICLEPLLPWLVPAIFGRSFAAAAALAQLLLLGSALWGVGQTLTGLLIGVGRPALASAADGAGVLTLGVGLVPLHSALGLPGAAVAVIVSSAVSTVLKAMFLAHGRDVSALALICPSPSALLRAANRTRASAGEPGV